MPKTQISLTVNGKAYSLMFLPTELANAKTLHLRWTLTSKPPRSGEGWGTGVGDAPPSFDELLLELLQRSNDASA